MSRCSQLDKNLDWKSSDPIPEDNIRSCNKEADNWEEVSLPSPE